MIHSPFTILQPLHLICGCFPYSVLQTCHLLVPTELSPNLSLVPHSQCIFSQGVALCCIIYCCYGSLQNVVATDSNNHYLKWFWGLTRLR